MSKPRDQEISTIELSKHRSNADSMLVAAPFSLPLLRDTVRHLREELVAQEQYKYEVVL